MNHSISSFIPLIIIYLLLLVLILLWACIWIIQICVFLLELWACIWIIQIFVFLLECFILWWYFNIPNIENKKAKKFNHKNYEQEKSYPRNKMNFCHVHITNLMTWYTWENISCLVMCVHIYGCDSTQVIIYLFWVLIFKSVQLS